MDTIYKFVVPLIEMLFSLGTLAVYFLWMFNLGKWIQLTFRSCQRKRIEDVPISAGYIVRHRWWVGLMVAFDILAVVFQWVMHVVSVSDKDDKTLMSKTYFQLKLSNEAPFTSLWKTLILFSTFNQNIWTAVANTGIPLRLFSIGRNYRLVDFDQRHPSLFNCIQSTRLSLFGVPHLQKSDEMFDDYSQFLASIYVELGLPFQMVEVGKENLCRSESRRHEVRLWSPDEERYIVCASVSHHNDYIANRLLSFQRRSNTYPCQFISGVAADVAVLLAAAMENGQQRDGSWAWPEICD